MILLPTSSQELIKDAGETTETIEANSQWLLVLDNTNIIGRVELRVISKITTMLGIYIKKEYRNKGYGSQIYQELEKYLKSMTHYRVVLGMVKESNLGMLKIAEKAGAKVCGLIKNGFYESNKFQNIIMYEIQLYNEVSNG